MRTLSTLTTAITAGVATLLFAAGPVAGQESPPSQDQPSLLLPDALQEVNPGEQEPDSPTSSPPVIYYVTEKRVFSQDSCPEGYERVPRKLEEEYSIKPPTVLCQEIPPGSLKQDGEPRLFLTI
jgi:hypothetical protein